MSRRGTGSRRPLRQRPAPKTPNGEVGRMESARLVERIAEAVGRITFGGERGDGSSSEVGLGLLDFYGKVTGDSILSAFARGALEGRTATGQKPAEEREATEPRSTVRDPAGYDRYYEKAMGKTFSLDAFRAARAEENAERKAKP